MSDEGRGVRPVRGGEKGYFKSRVFRRLFLSYALIIALFVGGFCAWYLYSYRANARAMAREVRCCICSMPSREAI